MAIAVVVVAEPLADTVTGPSLSLSESSPYEFVSGSTLFYAPTGSNSGSFTVTATASAASGIASVAFPVVFGSDSVTDTTSPYSQTYSWTSSASASGSKTVTATDSDIVADTGTATFVVTPDKTAPSGQTVALSGGPGYSAPSVPLTLGNGTDTGAGVDNSSGIVERASATLSTGTCGSFDSFAAVTLSGGADTTVATGHCYRYQYTAADNVGNVSTASTATSDAKVDSTPPTLPTLFFSGLTHAAASGSTVYYPRTGSGSFTVTAASTDSESGLASYTFPSASGFSVAGAGASRIFSFSGAQTAPAAPILVTATNGTGLTSTAASFTLVPDPTPPTVTILCNGKACLATPYAKEIAVTVAATDTGGSGVDTILYTIDGAAPTPDAGVEYEGGLRVRTLTHLKVRAYDKAGNASEVVGVTIRSLADRLVFAAPVQLRAKVRAAYVQARVSSSARAKVTAVMTGRGLRTPHSWRFILGSGTSIVRLQLPKSIKRPGRYTVVWNVQAGTKRSRASTRVVLGLP
jgi:chitobiase/beta-hexosaminidase-like protein/Big-like domain-containing protein